MGAGVDKWQRWLYATDAERRAAAEQGLKGRDAELLWELVQAHLSFRQKHEKKKPISTHTLHTYRMGVQNFLQFLREVPVEEHQLPTQQKYVDWLQGQHLAPMTVRTRNTAARHLTNTLIWAGLEQKKATARAALPSKEDAQSQPRPYTDAELSRLLSLADVEERLLVLLGLEAGLKAGEMVALTGQDVLLSSSPPTLNIVNERKGNASITVSPALEEALQAWFKASPPAPSKKILVGKNGEYAEDKLRRLCERAGVKYQGAGVEGLRLLAGIRFHRRNKHPEALMRFLRIGHKRNIRRYIELADQSDSE